MIFHLISIAHAQISTTSLADDINAANTNWNDLIQVAVNNYWGYFLTAGVIMAVWYFMRRFFGKLFQG